jgi:hypothetical protein
MGTLGGNVCVDTRCNYYNQSYEWRRAIGFCMKKDGDICLVAPGSARCWAVSSSDTAPVLWALGAEVTLVGPRGERRIPVSRLFRDDGIEYLGKAPDEIVTELRLPPVDGWRATYWKLRRRGSVRLPRARRRGGGAARGRRVPRCAHRARRGRVDAAARCPRPRAPWSGIPSARRRSRAPPTRRPDRPSRSTTRTSSITIESA